MGAAYQRHITYPFEEMTQSAEVLTAKWGQIIYKATAISANKQILIDTLSVKLLSGSDRRN